MTYETQTWSDTLTRLLALAAKPMRAAQHPPRPVGATLVVALQPLWLPSMNHPSRVTRHPSFLTRDA